MKVRGKASRREASTEQRDIAPHLQSVARGGLGMGISTAVSLALTVPTTAFLVRALGVKDYGALAFTVALTGLAATLADLGLSTGILRMSAFTED